MKGFENIAFVYFIGIGGIGMSALARLFHHYGMSVAGYDKTPTPLTQQLQSEGIRVHYHDTGQDVTHLTGPAGKTLVVVTPAVPENHGELQWFRSQNYTVTKRAPLLGEICRPFKCLAVSGTHGKTTVSTMAAIIMSQTDQGCGSILGGISKNLGTNLLIPSTPQQWMITEADEYDRSFLHLHPDVAVITSMDADHLDIYGHHEEVIVSFRDFAGNIRPGGSLLIKNLLKPHFNNTFHQKIFTYSLSGEADFTTIGLVLDGESRCYTFRLSTPMGISPEITMNYPGLVNVENAVAAGAAACLMGAGLSAVKKGLEAYTGVKRRFDIMLKKGNTLYIDDYAHHPEELKAFISSVKELYPDRHLTGIFQPHLYSRTRDFAQAFAKSLDLLDMTILLPVYPAREKPLAGVSSRLILQKMTCPHRLLLEKEEVYQYLKENPVQILLTMGAGDIDLMSGRIIDILNHETKN